MEPLGGSHGADAAAVCDSDLHGADLVDSDLVDSDVVDSASSIVRYPARAPPGRAWPARSAVTRRWEEEADFLP